MMWLLVGVGGALGSMARYGINQAADLWLPADFPFGTFIVNAAGCLAFGVIAGVITPLRSPMPASTPKIAQPTALTMNVPNGNPAGSHSPAACVMP